MFLTFHMGGEGAEGGRVVAGGEDKTVRLSLWRERPTGVFHPGGVLVLIRPRVTVPVVIGCLYVLIGCLYV